MLKITSRNPRGLLWTVLLAGLAGASVAVMGCGHSEPANGSAPAMARSTAPPPTNANVTPATQQQMAQQEQAMQQAAVQAGQAKAAAEAKEHPAAKH